MGSDHPLGKAVVYAIILSAVLHLAISFFVGAARGDGSIMNMFHILGFDLIWPDLDKGTLTPILGVALVVSFWAVIFAILTKLENVKKSAKEKVASKKADK